MRDANKITPEKIHPPEHATVDVDEDIVDISWTDSLKDNIQSFWESMI
ncbi:MAG: hypothetical protein R6U21_02600 [Thermoplasmatota archaeon]